jgi:hypothetical protein
MDTGTNSSRLTIQPRPQHEQPDLPRLAPCHLA